MCLYCFPGTRYLPGIVGLNNIKANDYCNVILQALSTVGPLRNFMLRDENYINIKRPPGDNIFLIVQRFLYVLLYSIGLLMVDL